MSLQEKLEEIKANRKNRQKQKVSVKDIFTNDKISGYKRGLAVLRAFNMLPKNARTAIYKCMDADNIGDKISTQKFQNHLNALVNPGNETQENPELENYNKVQFVFASRGLKTLFTNGQGTQGSAKTLENAMFIKLSENKFVVYSDANSGENKKTPDRRLWRIIKTCTCIEKFDALPKTTLADFTQDAQRHFLGGKTVTTQPSYENTNHNWPGTTHIVNNGQISSTIGPKYENVWKTLNQLGFDSSKLIKNGELWRNEGDQKLRALIEYNQTNKTLDVTGLFTKLGINSTPTINGAPLITDS